LSTALFPVFAHEKEACTAVMYNETTNDGTSPEGSDTETSEFSFLLIPDSCGDSTPVRDKSVRRFYVPRCGLVFYIMAFLGYFCTFTMRQSMSVAIVAMVNQTTVTEMDVAMTNVTDQAECIRDPELEHEIGEFSWDQNQQAVVLAAFYYGRVTQVRSMKATNLLYSSIPYCK